MGWLVGQFDRSAAGQRGRPRRVDRLVGQSGCRVGVDGDGGGEPDRAVTHDAQADADLGVVGRRLQPAVAQRDHLRADPLDPDLRVRRAEASRLTERGVADRGDQSGIDGGYRVEVGGHVRQARGG